VLTQAVALSMDGFDEAAIGHTRSEALDQLRWLIASIACQHVAVSPGGWGRGNGAEIQADSWAATTAYGAWLIWDQLPPSTRATVAEMMADEADYTAGRPPFYWADRDGITTPGRKGNSGADEVAWDASALAVALQMMPDHPHAPRWLRTATQMAAASYSSQDDTRSATPVNGVPLGERLDGFNTTPEGGVINHGGLHADYITVARQCWWAVMFGALGRQPVPEAFLLNGRRVWRALTQVQWPDTGTIYQPDGTIRYPDLHDWGQKQFPFYAATDAAADLLHLDVDPSSARAKALRPRAPHTRASAC